MPAGGSSGGRDALEESVSNNTSGKVPGMPTQASPKMQRSITSAYQKTKADGKVRYVRSNYSGHVTTSFKDPYLAHVKVEPVGVSVVDRSRGSGFGPGEHQD